MAQDAILGREEELAAIARFMDDGRSGPRAFLLEGEAGIGKTTLWREGLRRAAGKGLALESRASEMEMGLSFSVLGDLLAPALDGALEELPAGQRGALEAALLLGAPARSRPDARVISLAVLGVLRSLAAGGPVTIAIDDVQWTDTPSARALAFALRRLDDGSVLVLAARRVAPGLTDPLDLAGLPSGVERLTLGPIAPVPLGRLLWERLGRPFGPPLVKRIHEESGGNPFFAVEIGRALGSDDPNPRPGERLPVPLDLQELLRRRLSALSETANHALLIAAAAAQPTPVLVENAGGERSGLDDADEAGIVELRRGRIGFTHPLLASTVYTIASSRARRDVHASLASNVTDVEERARHVALSIDGPNEDAAAALEQAAQHAEARGAPTAAAELYQLAATLTPPETIEQRRRRQGELGNLWAAGDIAGARDLQRRLLAELGPGPDRAYTLYLMASASWNDIPRVTSLLTRALNEVGDDRLTRAFILADLAWAALWACELASSISWADAALEIADGLDEPGPLRATLSALAMAEGVLGHDANDVLERGISLEGALDYNELSTPRMCLGRKQTWAGELDMARETLQVELDRYVEQGREVLTWEVRVELAQVEYRAGHWQLAAEHARLALEIVVDVGWSDVLGQILPVKVAIASAMGEERQARMDGIEALEACQRCGDRWDEIHARSALGFLELSLGDHAACHTWLDPLVGLTETMGLREPGAFPFVPDEVEALVALGEVDQAEELIEGLEGQGRELDRALALATAARCRGLVHAARGQRDRALLALEQAVLQHARVAQPFELARTLLTLGEVQRRFKQRKDARGSLDAALTMFDRLGAPLWSARTEQALARTGASPGWGALTPTERQVAELVAEGKTNREVADAMFLSVKTIEANLSRVFHKLGARSRREVAARLAEPPPGDSP